MQPRIFGPYEPIRRDYPIEEYLADVAGRRRHAKSVYVQANWAKERFARRGPLVSADAARRNRLAASPSSPMRISPRTMCGRSSMRWRQYPAGARRPDAAALARQSALPLRIGARIWRAIRRSGATSRDLSDYGWAFDLQVFAPQMAGAAELADACPERHLRPAARRHAGGSVAGRPRGLARRHGAARAAAQRRGEAIRPRHLPASQRSGAYRFRGRRNRRGCSAPARCLFGSNFPIEKLWTRYAALVDAHRAATQPLSDRGPAGDLSRHRRRIYRLAYQKRRSNEGNNTWRSKSRCSTTATSSWNPASSCWGAIAAAPGGCRHYGFLILGGPWPIVVDTGYRHNQIMESLGMRGLQFHENMIENQLAQAWRADGRCALRAAHPPAHRPCRQGRTLPDEHDGHASTGASWNIRSRA